MIATVDSSAIPQPSQLLGFICASTATYRLALVETPRRFPSSHRRPLIDPILQILRPHRNPKVHKHHPPLVSRPQQVPGLHVSVDHSPSVNVLQRPCDGRADGQNMAPPGSPSVALVQHRMQALALQRQHHKIVRRESPRANGTDHVRMTE